MTSHRFPASLSPVRFTTLLSCLAVAALTACGGGSDEASAPAAAPAATAQAASSATVASFAGVDAQPTFHMAAAQLDEPSDVDADGNGASASLPPHAFAADAGVSTSRLTPAGLINAQRARIASAGASPAAAVVVTSAVYTPAQIRAAYGLPVLPAVGATLSATDAAALGAGQTIYVIDAYDHPNAYADLTRFSTKFGLPGCTSVALTATSALPLAKAGSTCTFSVAYTDSKAALLAAAPAYNADWIAEIALDVQWAHAIAPLARIVLIEVADSNSNSLTGGIALANKMGAGVVSMSFGASEGSWVTASDATLTTTGMTYIASAGDDGAQTLWPAVSPHVLAVGGTSLQWNGSGTRTESAWASSGGGVSAYEALPTWQSGTVVPGLGAAKMRAVSDVAFNANPNTGQYVALTAKGSTTTSWNAYGGTSIGVPQWAGLVAVANARRVLASKAVLGDFHNTIYKTIAGTAGTYASVFADIVDGNDGSCTSCAAAKGYDTVTGWGTPNAAALLNLLATDTTATTTTTTTTPAPVAVAPTVPGAALSGQTGTAFTASLNITAPTGVTTTYALSGAPAGLTVNSVGYVNWTSPVAGSYTFTATATTSAGKSASGKYTLTVIKVNHAPTLASSTISVKVGAALKATLVGVDVDGDAMTYTMTGAPSGMTLSSAGVLAWAKAVKGSYALKVTVKDSQGLAGAVATITVVAS